MAAVLKQLLSLLLVTAATIGAEARSPRYDDIDLGMRAGVMIKMLREVANQTNATSADTLNLPANASSIRENITDTFSCENRTYGYYADVDNECQVFHVCLPSQSASRRNVTYKWSFICPNETIFNQEVLVCTRPEDSIDCADSPMYYDRNDEIGKVNATMSDSNSTSTNTTRNRPEIEIKLINNNNARRKENKRKQNIVMAEEIMMRDDKVEIMDEGMMMIDDGKGSMMIDRNNANMKKKDIKRKENIVMANRMMMDGDKKENMMTNKNKKDPKMKQQILFTDGMIPESGDKEIMANSMMTASDMADQMKKEEIMASDMKKENGMEGQNNYANMPIMVAVKEERENIKKVMTDKDATNIELTDTSEDSKVGEPVIEEVASDFGTYSHGDMVEDSMDTMNERMALERSFKTKGKRIKRRGSFRFKADV